MKNMNDKKKKWLFVLGGLAVSIVLIAMIAGQFKKAPINDVDIPPQGNDSKNTVVEIPDIQDKENDIELPDVEIIEQQENSNGVDKGTEQTIQPNIPEKPTYTEEEIKNPNQKPNGDSINENDKVQDHNKVEKPLKSPKEDNQPQGGDVNSKGETYLPGFGWIENSGENHGGVAEDMYENGNKVGIMD